MWNNADEIAVFGNGQISAAPIGTALPITTLGALNAAFIGMGYVTEDGVTFSVGAENTDIPAWQSLDPVKTIKTSRQIQAGGALMQWNENTLPFALGGGVISGSTPNFKYTPPEAEDGMDERSVIIDANDGDQHYRLVLKRIVIVDAVEIQFQRGNPAVFPINMRVLKPADGSAIFELYTDGAGFAAGS